MSGVYPRALNHIAVSVPDIHQAVEFYTEVLGWYLTMPPKTIREEDCTTDSLNKDVFGEGWEFFLIAHLTTGNQVGVELFQFADQISPENHFRFNKTGIFHFCVQDPDIEGLAERIVRHGGKQRMAIQHYTTEDSLYRMVYMEDPFGNIIQINSHGYEATALQELQGSSCT